MPSMNNSNHKRICYDEEGKLECVCEQMEFIDQLFDEICGRVDQLFDELTKRVT